MSGGDPDYCTCKVGEVAWRIDEPNLPHELGDYWTPDDESERWTVREMTTYLNRLVVEKFCQSANFELVEGEADNYRRLLRSEGDVDEGTREEARGKLSRQGVDVEALEDSFVGTSTVYRHLQNCLGHEFERPDFTTRDAIDRTGVAIDTCRNTISGALSRLDFDEDEISSLTLSAQVSCPHCTEIYDIFEFINNDGCDCLNS